MRRIITVVLAVLIIAVVAVSAYYASFGNHSTSTSDYPSNSHILSLANAHWAAIGSKNITLLMSQYSTGYEAAWFYISNSSIGPTNGRYDCNIPRGVNNCNYFPAQAWETLFNDTGTWNYTVCNANVSSELDQRIVVMATVYYFLTQRNETLTVPYQMDFQYYNNTWAVWKEWFGLEQDQAYLHMGIKSVSCS